MGLKNLTQFLATLTDRLDALAAKAVDARAQKELQALAKEAQAIGEQRKAHTVSLEDHDNAHIAAMQALSFVDDWEPVDDTNAVPVYLEVAGAPIPYRKWIESLHPEPKEEPPTEYEIEITRTDEQCEWSVSVGFERIAYGWAATVEYAARDAQAAIDKQRPPYEDLLAEVRRLRSLLRLQDLPISLDDLKLWKAMADDPDVDRGLSPTTLRILQQAHDFAVNRDGYLMGLTRGDQGWEPTSIKAERWHPNAQREENE